MEDSEHIAGFILNKLYEMKLFGRTGNVSHGRHTSVDNLPKGYALKFRGIFPDVIKRLKKRKLIIIFPSNGEYHVCANLDTLSEAYLPMYIVPA